MTTAAEPRATTLVTALCWVQGVYYFITGVWPLVSVGTFIAITGPKTDNLNTDPPGDYWLVKTVGVLVAANALVLLFAAWRRRGTPEVALLAVGNAVALTGIDVIYVSIGQIPRIYLLDAAAEIPLIAAWLWALTRGLTVPPGR